MITEKVGRVVWCVCVCLCLFVCVCVCVCVWSVRCGQGNRICGRGRMYVWVGG